MIRKSHLSIALAGLALFAGSQAFACSTSLWGAGLTGGAGGAQSALGAVVAGQPNGGGGGTAIRYSGLCGLRAPSVGSVVQDGSAATEQTFIARFYAHVNMTSGTPVVYRVAEGAPDATNTTLIAIQYNRANQQFEAVDRSNVVSPIGAVNSAPNNKFYHVHLSWTRATGALVVDIKGGGTAAIPTANLTGFSPTPPGTAEMYASLGWVSGAATGTINVDAYESRRSTPIPQQCRGDANNSGGALNIFDNVAVISEINNVSLAIGQPDCNQDGSINVFDRICIVNLINTAVPGGQTCHF